MMFSGDDFCACGTHSILLYSLDFLQALSQYSDENRLSSVLVVFLKLFKYS